MKKIQIISLLVLAILVTSCVTTIPLNAQFYSTKKVGVIITIDSIGIAKAGGQGLLDMALTPGNRFYEPLKAVEPQLNCKKVLKIELQKVMNAKNKPTEFLELTMNVNALGKFETKDKSKKYAAIDYRKLKDTYQVDEILHLKVKYGLLVSYYGVIETGKEGFCEINSSIINLEDNSLLQKETLKSINPINGNWKKGDNYANLKFAIQNSINGGALLLKEKF